MDKSEFTIVPKLLGLVVNAGGEVAGILDASGLLTAEMTEALTQALGQVLAERRIEAARERLERTYLMPACDPRREIDC